MGTICLQRVRRLRCCITASLAAKIGRHAARPHVGFLSHAKRKISERRLWRMFFYFRSSVSGFSSRLYRHVAMHAASADTPGSAVGINAVVVLLRKTLNFGCV